MKTVESNRIFAPFQDKEQADSMFKRIVLSLPGGDEYNQLTTKLAHNRVVENFGNNCKNPDGFYKTQDMSDYFMQMINYYEYNLNPYVTGREQSGVSTLINMIISTFRDNPELADKIFP